MAKKKTVLILDDHPLVRDGLKTIMARAPRFKVVGSDVSWKAYRKNWARLIQRICNGDPLVCPRRPGKMRVISFTEQRE